VLQAAGWIYLARGIIVGYGRLFYVKTICVLISVLTKLKYLSADVNLLRPRFVCSTCHQNIHSIITQELRNQFTFLILKCFKMTIRFVAKIQCHHSKHRFRAAATVRIGKS